MGRTKRKPKVLFVTSEIYPLIKTGGLADVSSALPSALKELDADVRVMVPGYPAVLRAIERTSAIQFEKLGIAANLILARYWEFNFPLYVVDADIYARDGNPYQDESKTDFPDNALRFGLLCHAATMVATPISKVWRPDVVHCNDWQTGLVPALLSYTDAKSVATVMTIHNLAFQGVFPAALTLRLGLPIESFAMEGVEYYGQLSFLKAGLYFAHRITTVSPGYAEEIQSVEFGSGLHGLLQARRDHLQGILNGIDSKVWNPEEDPYIAQRYGIHSLDDKIKNKQALQQRFNLQSSGMLFGVVSRLTAQKGLDLVLAIAPALIAKGAQLVVLGSGDASLQQAFVALAKNHPGLVGIEQAYDEALAHRIEAGADSFLMPSRFEPCGLNQMYSMRYGTPPIARATGGLKDTVIDATEQTIGDGSATGFVFKKGTSTDLWLALERAFSIYKQPHLWRQLQINGMRRDFSWYHSAQRYLDLYKELINLKSL